GGTVLLPTGGFHSLEDGFPGTEVVRREVREGESQRVRLDDAPDGGDELADGVRGGGGDAHAAVGFGNGEPLLAELDPGLADGPPADAEAPGQVGLGKVCPLGQPSGEDVVPQAADDLLAHAPNEHVLTHGQSP